MNEQMPGSHPSRHVPIRNILISINVRWWNAEAAYAVNAARGLIQKGCRVWMVVNRDSPVHQKAVHFGIPVITDLQLDASSPVTQWSNYRKLLKFMQQNKVQVINSFKSKGAFLFSFIRKKYPDLTYIKTRGTANAPKNFFLNRYLYSQNACDGIITVGKTVAQWMIALAPANNIRTIYYGDSAVDYEKQTRPQKIRKQLSIPDDAIVLSLIGRAQKKKGHAILLESLALLRDRRIHVLFLIKGLDEYSDELREMRDYIKRNGLDDRVTLLGFQQELGNIMRMIDIGVIPSIASEVNCRVAVEFLSMGIPVIAFPTGSLPEVITHQKTGLICQKKTAESLRESIEELLDTDYSEMGKQAYLSFRNQFDLPVFSHNILQFYKQCRN